jgi:hypothetical protein
VPRWTFRSPGGTASVGWSHERASAFRGVRVVREKRSWIRRVVEYVFEAGVVFCTVAHATMFSTVSADLRIQCRRPLVR